MNFNGRFQNKKEMIDIRCPECQVVAEYEYDESIKDDILTCPECEHEFFYEDVEEEKTKSSLPDVDLTIPDPMQIIEDQYAYIIEHCNSNEQLKEILIELYAIAFVNGTKQAMVNAVQKTLEEIDEHNETFSFVEK